MADLGPFEFASTAPVDCNGNGEPDGCEAVNLVSAESGDLGSIEAGAALNMRAILQELSHAIPASIKLNSLRVARNGDIVRVRLHGRAIEIDTVTGQTEVGIFIAALRASSLFRDANLRDVERGSFAEGNGERFEAAFQAVLAPHISAIQVASGDEGDLP